jgi:Transcriptional regulator, AbiEi antitoxin
VLTGDHAADRIASRQYGLILRSQAVECGLTPRQVDTRVASGRWIVVAPGVYRIAAVPVSWHQRALAACLARRPHAVASHTTAAALHGLISPPTHPHITVPRTATSRSALAVVHRSTLTPKDRVNVAGIPCTSVDRTIVDCAALMGDARLGRLVDAAFCEGSSHPRVVRTAIDRAQAGPGKNGVTILRRVLEAWTPTIAPGSPAEMRLLRQIRQWGFPSPELQVEILTPEGFPIGRIDAGWRSIRFGLEYDSDRFHAPRRWDHDERRQARFDAAGWDVRHVDAYDLRAGTGFLRELLASRLSRSAA